MALQFPSNPAVGQVFTSPQGVSWTFDGQKWACGGSPPAPAGPVLSNPTVTNITATTATAQVTTSGAGGTLSWAVAPGSLSGSQAVTQAGVQQVALSGLATGTTYTVTFNWTDGSGAAASPVTASFVAGGGVIPTPGGDTVPMNQIVFTASGQYTPSANLVSAIVEIVGGGGAGGGVVGQGSTVGVSGGGGGSGAYTRAVFTAAQIGSGQTVTIGQGGIAVSGASQGGSGGATTFGSLISAAGGTGGAQLGAGEGGTAMANPPIGVLALSGSDGADGFSVNAPSVYVAGGVGAGSFFGGDTKAPVPAAGGVGAAGLPGMVGAGGSGAASNEDTATLTGGNGGSGLCVITEFTSSP